MSDEEQIADTLRKHEANRETDRAWTDAELAMLHTNEQGLKTEEARWLDAYAKGAIEVDELQERMTTIRKQKDVLAKLRAELQERIQQNEAMQAQQDVIKHHVALAKKGLPALEFDDRRDFLEAISFKGVVDGETDTLFVTGYIRSFEMSISGKGEAGNKERTLQLSTYYQRVVYSNERKQADLTGERSFCIPFSFTIPLTVGA